MASPVAVAWSGLAALAVAMGIGRFAFTPVLPMMQADAGLTFAQGGWLAAANYAGYFVGSVWAGRRPAPSDAAIRWALAAVALTTLGAGWTGSLAAWLLLRFAAGIASAWVLVHVSAWALLRLAGRPAFSGVLYAGVGVGMALAGGVCLAALHLHATSGAVWIALGLVSIAIAAATAGSFGAGSSGSRPPRTPVPWSAWLVELVACYGALGLGYIVPATYLPAMARELVGGSSFFGWVWPLFGAAAALSTVVAGAVFAPADNRKVWAGAHLVMALGSAAPLVVPGAAGLIVAAVCVGGTFMVATMAGLREGARAGGAAAARVMAAMTASFAAGQMVGPILATMSAGALRPALGLGAALLAASGILLWLRKERQDEPANAGSARPHVAS